MGCTVIEKELLRIVENLKEFRTILFYQKLKIYNNHKNAHVISSHIGIAQKLETRNLIVWSRIIIYTR